MIGKKYTAEFKRLMVEEYLSLKSSNPKFSKSEFAYQKGMKILHSMIGWSNIKDKE